MNAPDERETAQRDHAKIDLSQVLNRRDPAQEMQAREMQRTHDELLKAMSPAGALGLSALLDERRLQYGLPDGLFKHQATFDRVLAFQIPRWEGSTFGDTVIQMPDSFKKKEKEMNPRAIIISAGLRALDNLRSNGVDLGHIITFVRLSPWRFPADMVRGTEFHLLVMYAGDIIASEDTRASLVSGDIRVEPMVLGHHLEHTYVDKDGKWYRAKVTDNSEEGY